MDIKELLSIAVQRKSSDMHLLVNQFPILRINGELHSLVTFPELTVPDIETMIFSLINSSQKEVLITNRELDFSTIIDLGSGKTVRFRGNAYYQKGSIAASFRVISSVIPSIEELNLPSFLHQFTRLKQGFILVTGPTGQGKSTTLASLIAEITLSRVVHVITIEDPIEYIYPKGKSIVSQREMYQDTHSWKGALKSVLREDPDIVYIGEMRDLETVSSALTIAETGHLVFSTLHTNSAGQTIDRIVDIFPDTSRDQVRLQLSMVLSGIITQRLVPSISGSRIPVCEIMLGTQSIKNTIREGKTHLIDNIIQTSSGENMMLFEEHLKQLVVQNLISPEVALDYALRPDRYIQLMEQ